MANQKLAKSTALPSRSRVQAVDIVENAVQDERHNQRHIVMFPSQKPQQQVATLDDDVGERDRVGRYVRRNEANNPRIKVDVDVSAWAGECA